MPYANKKLSKIFKELINFIIYIFIKEIFVIFDCINEMTNK
jgi:hypothetical protein